MSNFGLLEIACGAGRSDCLRFLTTFCGLEPGPESMRQALASENNEMVRDVWNRLSEAQRAEGLVSFADVAADYHNYIALGWLVGFASPVQFEAIAESILKWQLAGPLVTLMNCGFSVTRCSARRGCSRKCPEGRSMILARGRQFWRLLRRRDLMRGPRRS